VWRAIGIAVLVAGLILVGVVLFFFGGREPTADPFDPPHDDLAVRATSMPPGKIKVGLESQPESPPTDATELRYEWAAFGSVRSDDLSQLTPDERRQAAGKSGWAVVRYVLTVKAVGLDDDRGVPEAERVKPKPGMMFVRHEGEERWAIYLPRVERSHGTAEFRYHVPGEPKVLRLFARGPDRVRQEGGPEAQPKRVEVFKPWTYSVEAKAGPLADVVKPVLTDTVVVELPARVDVLRVGDAVTALDLRP
jgi:hypothetical protein